MRALPMEPTLMIWALCVWRTKSNLLYWKCSEHFQYKRLDFVRHTHKAQIIRVGSIGSALMVVPDQVIIIQVVKVLYPLGDQLFVLFFPLFVLVVNSFSPVFVKKR